MATDMLTDQSGVWKISEQGKALLEETYHQQLPIRGGNVAALEAIEAFFTACGEHGLVGYNGPDAPTFHQIIEEFGNAFVSMPEEQGEHFRTAYTHWCVETVVRFNPENEEERALASVAVKEFGRNLKNLAPVLVSNDLVTSREAFSNLITLSTSLNKTDDQLREDWRDEAPGALFGDEDTVDGLIATRDGAIAELAAVFAEAMHKQLV